MFLVIRISLKFWPTPVANVQSSARYVEFRTAKRLGRQQGHQVHNAAILCVAERNRIPHFQSNSDTILGERVILFNFGPESAIDASLVAIGSLYIHSANQIPGALSLFLLSIIESTR